MIALLQAGYYAEPHAARYDAATMGMFVLIIAIGVIGFIVQARLQSVFKKYSKVQFPGGLTGAEVAEKMLRDNNIHNVKVTHVGGHLTDHFNPQTMTVNLSWFPSCSSPRRPPRGSSSWVSSSSPRRRTNCCAGSAWA